MISPFVPVVSDADLGDLRDRLSRTRWPDKEPVEDWSQGVPLSDLQALCSYWASEYDWRSREPLLNAHPQFRTEIDGVGIHFLHIRSAHSGALPLVLTHGWPGSYLEFLDVIDPLTSPADPADAFDLVIPSLPGYGWSDAPSAVGWGIEQIADAWHELMDRLGYSKYGAQGGDWGSAVTTCLAQQHPDALVGIHLNMPRGKPEKGQTEFDEAEQRTIAAGAHYQDWDSGYSKQQATRPQTLGYGLTDSPAAQCAWILEKFWSWADCDGDPVAALGADRLLDNITLYWLSNTATSSARLYWESFTSPRSGRVDVPVGASAFPKEIVPMTRAWVERTYPTLAYFGQPERGGHFAAFEQPAIFTEELRNFFRLVR